MEIATKRFLLREFTEEDETAFLAYQSDPRYAQFCAAGEVGVDQARALLRHFREWAAEQPRRNYQLAISDIRHPRGLIGCCGLRCEGDRPDQAEMGIELAPRFWGRYAYATEIASALIDFGFATLGLSEVRGISVSANSRIARLAHRYGFVAVGRRPGPEWMRAQGWHHTEWQLTRERWEVFQSSNVRSSRRHSSGASELERLNLGGAARDLSCPAERVSHGALTHPSSREAIHVFVQDISPLPCGRLP